MTTNKFYQYTLFVVQFVKVEKENNIIFKRNFGTLLAKYHTCKMISVVVLVTLFTLGVNLDHNNITEK
jgi:hypothetical protein